MQQSKNNLGSRIELAKEYPFGAPYAVRYDANGGERGRRDCQVFWPESFRHNLQIEMRTRSSRKQRLRTAPKTLRPRQSYIISISNNQSARAAISGSSPCFHGSRIGGSSARRADARGAGEEVSSSSPSIVISSVAIALFL